MSSHKQVLIVGAGLAGLACALQLKKSNIPFIILEAANAAGGRIRTDLVDGFRLDRGFQVLLTAYPEAKKILNYEGLRLKPFLPGALVRYRGRYRRVSDPFRDPAHVFHTLSAPIGTISDKLCVAQLRCALAHARDDGGGPQRSTLDSLRHYGFSDSMIERFFRPFFGGVFLEPYLSTAERNFAFLFRMFSCGDTVLPENGMEEIPKQLARQVGRDNIRLNTRVSAVGDNVAVLTTGEKVEAPHIVIATEVNALGELLCDSRSASASNSVTCLYYAADRSPIAEPILVLNGDGDGVINNLCVPSLVSSAYAPAGKSLISVSVLGNPVENDAVLEQKVRSQLEAWFGAETRQWQHLRTYRIKNALPQQFAGTASDVAPRYEVKDGLYVCGDHMSIGSINGALESGRRVAELVRARLEQSSRAAG